MNAGWPHGRGADSARDEVARIANRETTRPERNYLSPKARQATALHRQRHRLRSTGQSPGDAPKCSPHSSNELAFKILDEQFFRRINPGNAPSAERYCGKRILHHQTFFSAALA